MSRSSLFLAVIVSWTVSARFHVVDAQKAAMASKPGGSKTTPITEKNPAKSAASRTNNTTVIRGNFSAGGDTVPTCECGATSAWGCAIWKPSNVKFTACLCSWLAPEKQGQWRCSGKVVPCPQVRPDPLFTNVSQFCSQPDTSIGSCYLGMATNDLRRSGNCGGYFSPPQPASCDCDYRRGGCTISRAAPQGTACSCSYDLFWTCSGSVVECSDVNHINCRFPDKSRSSCRQGRGDCGGY